MSSVPLYEYVSHFPDDFFNKDVNEVFIKELVGRALNIQKWVKGNPNRFEPDYYGDNIPFEFTIASDSKRKNNYIQKMINHTYVSDDIENDIINYVIERIEDKSKKNYCVNNVHLCVLCLMDIFVWLADEYGSELSFIYENRKNKLFRKIKAEFIDKKTFGNVFIILPDVFSRWWIFDVMTGNKSFVYIPYEAMKTGKYPFYLEKNTYERFFVKQGESQ